MKIRNPLTRWNQLNELEDLQHTLRSLFRRSWAHSPKDPVKVTQFIPLVDVSEDAGGYLIKAELPQVKKEDVKITLADGRLTITGERKFDRNKRREHPFGFAQGRFAHSFVVPNDARPAKVTSAFKNGVLEVHLARNKKGRPAQPGKARAAARVPSTKGFTCPVHLAGNTAMTRTIRNRKPSPFSPRSKA